MAVDPDKPFNREEMYLAKAAGEGTTVPDEPWSRKEAYLDKISGRMDGMEEQIAALATDLSFKGSVESEADLPTGAATGDTYITEDTGVMYVWTGDDWVALGGTGINVVQTTGTSTTDVMSQNATTSMIYTDPSSIRNIRLGYGATVGNDGVAIGRFAYTSGNRSIAIGGAATSDDSDKTKASGQNSIAIGSAAQATSGGAMAIGYHAKATNYGIALGPYSTASVNGVISCTSSVPAYGYNNTNFRLIKGLYDPIDLHDAATKGYVDTHLGGLSFVALTQAQYDALATKDPNTLYIIKAA